MNDFRLRADPAREPPFKGRFSFFPGKGESGNVLFYVFLAVSLMAALTYAFVKDSRENFASQSAVRIAEELFSQANMIRAAIVQCAMEYPQGGGNIDNTGGSANKIDYADNPNNPYPINPSSALNPNAPAGVAAAANDNVRNLTCVGAPAGAANMFQGAGNQGRFLPPPPSGFSEWVYVNDTSGAPAPNGKGVYIQITAPNDAAALNALDRFMAKFSTCQADLDYDSCGARCLTVWVQRNACP